MNLDRRVAQGQGLTGLNLAMHTLEYPLQLILPLVILALSIFSVWPYLGDVWQVGSFSTRFWPILSGWVGQIFQIPQDTILNWFVILGYILGPVVFYEMVYAFSGRHLPAFLTGLLTILPNTPFANTAPERLRLVLVEQDGAHILGLTLLAWIAVVYLRYLRKGKMLTLGLFGLLVSFLASISIFTVTLLLVFMVFECISEILVNEGRIKLKRFGLSLVVVAAVVVAVYNVFLWSIIVSNEGREAWAVVWNLFPMSFFLLPVLGTFAFLIFDRRPNLQPVFIALSLAITFGLLHGMRSNVTSLSVVDPDRYIAEVSMASAFVIGIVVTWIFDFLRGGKGLSRWPKLMANRLRLAFGLVLSLLVILVALIIFIPRSIS